MECVPLKYVLCLQHGVVTSTGNARVAQWWSIALPRRGSRVRIPSRAFFSISKSMQIDFFLWKQEDVVMYQKKRAKRRFCPFLWNGDCCEEKKYTIQYIDHSVCRAVCGFCRCHVAECLAVSSVILIISGSGESGGTGEYGLYGATFRSEERPKRQAGQGECTDPCGF